MFSFTGQENSNTNGGAYSPAAQYFSGSNGGGGMNLSNMYAALQGGYYNPAAYQTSGSGKSGNNTYGEVSPVGYHGQIPGYTIAAQPDVNKLTALPYSLAAAIAAAAGTSQAANASAIGNAMGNYYTAAGGLQSAPYSAWANTQSSRMNNLGNMNVAQIQSSQKLAGLRDLLAMVDAQMGAQRTSQNQNRYNQIGTNYGAGVNFG